MFFGVLSFLDGRDRIVQVSDFRFKALYFGFFVSHALDCLKIRSGYTISLCWLWFGWHGVLTSSDWFLYIFDSRLWWILSLLKCSPFPSRRHHSSTSRPCEMCRSGLHMDRCFPVSREAWAVLHKTGRLFLLLIWKGGERALFPATGAFFYVGVSLCILALKVVQHVWSFKARLIFWACLIVV